MGTSDECSELQKEERRKGLVFEDSVPGVLAGVAAGMNGMLFQTTAKNSKMVDIAIVFSYMGAPPRSQGS